MDSNDIMHGKDGLVLVVVVLGLGVCGHWAQAGAVGDGGGVVTDGAGKWMPLLGR